MILALTCGTASGLRISGNPALTLAVATIAHGMCVPLRDCPAECGERKCLEGSSGNTIRC
jgi:hypothetical protein